MSRVTPGVPSHPDVWYPERLKKKLDVVSVRGIEDMEQIFEEAANETMKVTKKNK